MAVTNLNSWNKRKLLPLGKKNYERLGDGIFLVYRPMGDGAGAWGARLRTADGGDFQGKIGTADDGIEADGQRILTYSQAIGKAIEWCRGKGREARGEAPAHKGRYTVADAMQAYLRDLERRGKKGVPVYRSVIDAWIVPILGSVEVAKLTQGMIENWLDGMAASPRYPKSPSPRPPATDDEKRARRDTANRVLGILKAALSFAIRRRWANCEPVWKHVENFKGVSKPRANYLEADDAARLVNSCQGDFRDLVKGALLTGCRYGELARLRCKDFSSDNGSIFIATSKSGRPRYIDLDDQGVDLFNGLVAKRQSNDDLVFVRDSTGQGWKDGDQRKPMQAACKRAGLSYRRFHELRHTYATLLLNSESPPSIYDVAEQLGHRDTRMIERHYGHIIPSRKANAIRAAVPNLGIVDGPKVAKLRIGKKRA